MKYSIKQNWANTAIFMMKKPMVMWPFMIIVFFEFLALELIFFSTRKPLLAFTGPLVKKFFGEGYLHYPGNILISPQLFYYADVAIYIVASVALMSVSVNMFINAKSGLPVRTGVMVKNAVKRYISFVLLGVILIALMVLINKTDMFILKKIVLRVSRLLPYKIGSGIFLFLTPLMIFVSNLFLQVFMVLTVPIMVIQKRSIVVAIAKSIYFGVRRFFTVICLIFLPFLVYLPIIILKSGAAQIANNTFPEVIMIITGMGILASMFVDCFIILSVSQFLLDTDPQIKVKK